MMSVDEEQGKDVDLLIKSHAKFRQIVLFTWRHEWNILRKVESSDGIIMTHVRIVPDG